MFILTERQFHMGNFLDPLFHDILERMKSPDVQSSLEVNILRPVMMRILNMLYPYIFGVMLLWIMMFICLALILIILIRGSIVDLFPK